MKYYKIDVDKLATLLLPVILRKSVITTFIQVLVSPIKKVYEQFIQFRDANIYHIGITPQVCYIEKVLNDRFDKKQRRIYITQGITYDEIFLFLDTELTDEYIYQDENKDMYIFNQLEVGAESADFIINVPSELQPDEPDLRAITETYKLASKLYNINWL